MPEPAAVVALFTIATANVQHAREAWRQLAELVGWQEADKASWWKRALRAGAHGWTPAGPGREVTISWDDEAGWDTRAGGAIRTHAGMAGISPHRYIAWILAVRGTLAVLHLNTHFVSGVRGRRRTPMRWWRLARWYRHKVILDALVAIALGQPVKEPKKTSGKDFTWWRDAQPKLIAFRAMVERHRALGFHVVVTGDFNDTPARCRIPGLRVVSSEHSGGIDQIHFSAGLHVAATRQLRKGRSDHPPFVATLSTAPAPVPPRPPKPPTPPTPEVTVKKLPANLPDLLRAEGLKVVVLKGWQDRGRPASTGGFNPVGVLWHHTGSYDSLTDAQNDRQYAAWLGLTGRSDLPAPLCHLSISAEGVVYVIAAGRANHAGKARASGSVAAGDGNELYVGVECMNSGKQGWGKPQYDAMVKTAVVLSRVLAPNGSPRAQRGHRETSITGKWDPGMLDLDKFRADLEAALTPAPTPDQPNRVELANLAIQAAIDNAQATVPASRVEAHRGYDDLEARLARMPRR